MLEFDRVGFVHDGACGRPAALEGVSFSVAPGRIVAVCGENGSGKSTLSRLACGLVAPTTGCVHVDGLDAAVPENRLRVHELVGFVGQDPVNQVVSTVCSDEVAFGPKNLGLSPEVVSERVRSALAYVGLAGFEGRATVELSGGELQRLAVAGALAMHPRYLMLDEACAQLDEAAREQMRLLIRRLAAERGMGILNVTHDAAEVACSDDVLVLDGGRIVWAGSTKAFFAERYDLLERAVQVDSLSPLLHEAAKRGVDPSSVAHPQRLAQWLSTQLDADAMVDRVFGGWHFQGETVCGVLCGDTVLLARGVRFSYDESPALQGVDLALQAGDVLLVSGRSGSGKSTLMCMLAGLYEPDEGTVELEGAPVRPGSVGLAFQRPEDQLFCMTVEEDIAFGPQNIGLPEDEVRSRVRDAAGAVMLDEELLSRSPYELSGGQMRRAAIAGVVALHPKVYLLDEPTAGLDVAGRSYMRGLVRSLAAREAAVVVVTHDVEEWLPIATRAVLLADGRIAWSGAPAELAEDCAPYECAGLLAPQAVRLRALMRSGDQRSAQGVGQDAGAGADAGVDAGIAVGADACAAAALGAGAACPSRLYGEGWRR